MISKASANYIRISPRKIRLVIDLVRGKTVKQGMFILDNLNKKGALYIRELLLSAVANAKRVDKSLDEQALLISTIFADGGPVLKRFRAASMGRASRIIKRTSHVYIELDRILGKKEVLANTAAPALKTKKEPVKKVEDKSKKVSNKKKLTGAK